MRKWDLKPKKHPIKFKISNELMVNYSKFISQKVRITYVKNNYGNIFTNYGSKNEITGILVGVPQKMIFNKYIKMLWFSIETFDKIISIPISDIEHIYLIEKDDDILIEFKNLFKNTQLKILNHDVLNYIIEFIDGWEKETLIL